MDGKIRDGAWVDPDTNPLQMADKEWLMAASAGRIDAVREARMELANRGLSQDGKWVNFTEAARLAGEAQSREALAEVEEARAEAEMTGGLSSRFLSLLSEEIGEDNYKEVAKRNSTEPNPSVCHSHDFCDANVVMERAFEEEFERPLDLDDDGDMWIVNASWAQARDVMEAGYGQEVEDGKWAEDIARRHLHIETLETRKSDGLDFHDVAVWCLRDALTEALSRGREMGAGNASAPTAETVPAADAKRMEREAALYKEQCEATTRMLQKAGFASVTDIALALYDANERIATLEASLKRTAGQGMERGQGRR